MRHERLITICISTVMVMAGQGVISPVLPLFAKDFAVSTALVGATITAFGLARLVTNIPAGTFADRRGRRFLLVGGPVVTAVGMIGSGLAGSIWMLLVWRFVAGAGSGLYMTGAQIYLVDIAEEDQRGRYIATNQGALLVGVSLGPALGGWLAESSGLRAPFFVVGGAALLTAIYGYLRLPETRRPDEAVPLESEREATLLGTERHEDALTPHDFVRSPSFLAIGFVSFAVFSIRAGARQTLVPLELSDTYDFSSGDIGLLFTVLGSIALLLIWPAGMAVDRLGPKILIVPTALAAAVGMGLVGAAPSLPWFVAGLVIAAMGTGITGPAPAAFVANLVPESSRGAAMGMYRTFGDLGVVISPVLSGLLADAASRSVAIMANAVVIGVAGLAFWMVSSRPESIR